jgi:hypothetical protein
MKYDDSWFGILSNSALSGLRGYYTQSESSLASARDEDLSRIKEEVNKLAETKKLTEDEEYSEYSLLIDEHEITYDMFFTNLFRHSFVVLANLFLEDHLHKLSMALYKLKGNRELPPKPKGNIIATLRGYIDSFGLSYDKSLWDFVDDLRVIRNCIVHASGDISQCGPDQQAHIRGIAAKNIGIHIGGESTQYKLKPLYLDDDMIIIEPRYCETIINGVANLIKALCKAADLALDIQWDFKST